MKTAKKRKVKSGALWAGWSARAAGPGPRLADRSANTLLKAGRLARHSAAARHELGTRYNKETNGIGRFLNTDSP